METLLLLGGKWNYYFMSKCYPLVPCKYHYFKLIWFVAAVVASVVVVAIDTDTLL